MKVRKQARKKTQSSSSKAQHGIIIAGKVKARTNTN